MVYRRVSTYCLCVPEVVLNDDVAASCSERVKAPLCRDMANTDFSTVNSAVALYSRLE